MRTGVRLLGAGGAPYARRSPKRVSINTRTSPPACAIAMLMTGRVVERESLIIRGARWLYEWPGVLKTVGAIALSPLIGFCWR